MSDQNKPTASVQIHLLAVAVIKPIDQVKPYIYWSESQIRQALDSDARPARKSSFKFGIQIPVVGPRFESSHESIDAPSLSAPRAQQEEAVRRLLADVATPVVDPNGQAPYSYGTAHAYWGVLRLPSGEPSYAAMFGIEPEPGVPDTMICLFGPRRNYVDRTPGKGDVDAGDVHGWSSSSATGQKILLGIGGYDPSELQLDTPERASAARDAVNILKGQGILSHGHRSESGLIAQGLVSYFCRVYFWEEDVQFENFSYRMTGVGAPLWVKQESQVEYLTGRSHRAGVTNAVEGAGNIEKSLAALGGTWGRIAAGLRRRSK